MLKKIVVGVICFALLAFTAAGIYLYTLDWNKHKAVVAQRLSQITGLSAVIDGNLRVELLPTPKFTASQVRFFKPSDRRNPLVSINEISALVDLMPLFENKFILNSMKLVHAQVSVNIDKDGVSNWKNVSGTNSTKSGNVEVSFNDVSLSGSVIDIRNEKTNQKLLIDGITAKVSAPKLSGPYKTSGNFKHNNQNINFDGNIVNKDSLNLKLAFNSLSSGTKLNIEGTFGNNSTGLVSFETKSLLDASNIIYGDKSMADYYKQPCYTSFKYAKEGNLLKLNNFTLKYGNNTAGTGSVILNRQEKNANFDFNLAKFDFSIISNLAKDIISYQTSGKKLEDSSWGNYKITANLKSENVYINEAEGNNLSMVTEYNKGIIDIARLGMTLPGNSVIKTVGKINIKDKIGYKFDQNFNSNDLRVFASIFNIDLVQFAKPENKKSIFKSAQAKITYEGNLEKLKVSLQKAAIDTTIFNGNIGLVKRENDVPFVLADLNASKIIFDRYLNTNPDDLKNASLKDKVVAQFNLSPWKNNVSLEAEFRIKSAVYRDVPMEDVLLKFISEKDNLEIQNFDVKNFAGAQLNVKSNISEIYTNPQFENLTYDIKTNNFPLLASSLKLDLGDKKLFKRPLFATKGIINGSLNKFELNSLYKLGDVEFSYHGDVVKDFLSGAIEFKANNLSSFIQSMNFDYNPDIPVTPLTLSGTFAGNSKKFKLDNISAYLGANHISGNVKTNITKDKNIISANGTLDRFEADRWFLLPKNIIEYKIDDKSTFASRPIFSDKKIDYSKLKNYDLDFDISAKELILLGKNYSNAKVDFKLSNGLLTVDNFSSEQNDYQIKTNFVLDTNDFAKLNGKLHVTKLQTPSVGGKVYTLDSGLLNLDGTYNSSLLSQKDFINNLNAEMKFTLFNTGIDGFDFDMIKFELEQRTSTDKFEEDIIKSLSSGKSLFEKVSGEFNVKKGTIFAKNIIWNSPVLNMETNLNLDLINWTFNADFNGLYLNASFPDILKFSLQGSLNNPQVSVDLSEPLKRVKATEEKVENIKHEKEKEYQNRISSKLKVMQIEIDNVLKDINRLSLNITRYAPITQNKDVNNIYNNCVKDVKTSETKVRDIAMQLKKDPAEEKIMNLETDLAKVTAKLRFIPKALEENFVVDSKYIYDDIFNKIAWVFNVAQNNNSYYENLIDAYMVQIDILEKSGTPVTSENLDALYDGKKLIKDTFNQITETHNEVRDNYLNVIDTNKVTDMQNTNALATKTLNDILSMTHKLDNSIADNIDLFRSVLGIKSRDFDKYLVYPPKIANDIDIAQPTMKDPTEIKEIEKASEKQPVSGEKLTSNSALDTEKSDINNNEVMKTEDKVSGKSAAKNEVKNNVNLVSDNKTEPLKAEKSVNTISDTKANIEKLEKNVNTNLEKKVTTDIVTKSENVSSSKKATADKFETNGSANSENIEVKKKETFSLLNFLGLENLIQKYRHPSESSKVKNTQLAVSKALNNKHSKDPVSNKIKLSSLDTTVGLEGLLSNHKKYDKIGKENVVSIENTESILPKSDIDTSNLTSEKKVVTANFKSPMLNISISNPYAADEFVKIFNNDADRSIFKTKVDFANAPLDNIVLKKNNIVISENNIPTSKNIDLDKNDKIAVKVENNIQSGTKKTFEKNKTIIPDNNLKITNEKNHVIKDIALTENKTISSENNVQLSENKKLTKNNTMLSDNNLKTTNEKTHINGNIKLSENKIIQPASKMKVNPIIALNIGKNEVKDLKIEKITKKSGFKSKINDKDIEHNIAEKDQNKMPSEIDTKLSELDVDLPKPVQIVHISEVLQEPTKISLKGSGDVDLYTLFSENKLLNNYTQHVNDFTNNAIVVAEKNNVKKDVIHKYLYNTSETSNIVTSGIIGKSMLSAKNEVSNVHPQTKYLFATRSHNPYVFGELGKTARLVIK